MIILHVDLMWALVLLGVTLWTTCCVLMNPGLRGVRWVGIASSYVVGAWMAVDVAWLEAVVTWTVFASLGGALALAYELWARRRYRGTGRPNRPLVLLHGLVLWPALIPDVLEGVLVDAGVLQAGHPGHASPATSAGPAAATTKPTS